MPLRAAMPSTVTKRLVMTKPLVGDVITTNGAVASMVTGTVATLANPALTSYRFIDGPKVMNGASDLMVTAFAEKGRHARTTIGVASCPCSTRPRRVRAGAGFEANFNLVKKHLGHTVHLHNLKDTKFPYQLQLNLLVKMNWDGWALLEASDEVPDRVAALIEQRELWDQMMAKALKG